MRKTSRLAIILFQRQAPSDLRSDGCESLIAMRAESCFPSAGQTRRELPLSVIEGDRLEFAERITLQADEGDNQGGTARSSSLIEFRGFFCVRRLDQTFGLYIDNGGNQHES